MWRVYAKVNATYVICSKRLPLRSYRLWVDKWQTRAIIKQMRKRISAEKKLAEISQFGVRPVNHL